jgi:hypothetical protein
MKFLRSDDELFGEASSNVNSKLLGLGDLDLPDVPAVAEGEGLYPRWGMGEGVFPRLFDGLALP